MICSPDEVILHISCRSFKTPFTPVRYSLYPSTRSGTPGWAYARSDLPPGDDPHDTRYGWFTSFDAAVAAILDIEHLS